MPTRYKWKGEEFHTNCFIDFCVDTNLAVKILFENPYDYFQLAVNRTSEIESNACDKIFFKTFAEDFFPKQNVKVFYVFYMFFKRLSVASIH